MWLSTLSKIATSNTTCVTEVGIASIHLRSENFHLGLDNLFLRYKMLRPKISYYVNKMSRDPKTILSEIKGLVGELESVLGGSSPKHKKPDLREPSSLKKPKGVPGSIAILIEEGFFDTPKGRNQIMERLKEIGHYHNKPAVDMNLLGLTRKRTLNRFKNKSTKNWEYVIRK